MLRPTIGIFICLLLVSCNRNNCDGFKSKFTPDWNETYFELLKPDGSSYKSQEVKISSLRKFENGQLVSSNPNYDQWYDLIETNYHDSIPDIKIFGKGFESNSYVSGLIYARGPDECGYGYFENWNREQFYLLEFPNQQFDTLLIKDILAPGGKRSFKYYINSVEIEKNYFMYYRYLQIIH